jgi:hypothetical protein
LKCFLEIKMTYFLQVSNFTENFKNDLIIKKTFQNKYVSRIDIHSHYMFRGWSSHPLSSMYWTFPHIICIALYIYIYIYIYNVLFVILNTYMQSVSKRALQVWNITYIYSEDVYIILNCHNAAGRSLTWDSYCSVSHTSTGNLGCFKTALEWFSKCYCVASVTKTFTPKSIHTICRSTPWTMDSLYASKYKYFKNTHHTVTFEIPLYNSF